MFHPRVINPPMLIHPCCTYELSAEQSQESLTERTKANCPIPVTPLRDIAGRLGSDTQWPAVVPLASYHKADNGSSSNSIKDA